MFSKRVIQSNLYWLLATLGLSLQFVVQMSSGLFLHPFARDFHLTTTEVGWLVGSYYYIYVIMQLPAGLLVDRLGARVIVSCGCLLSAICLMVFANTDHVWVAMLARLGAGFGFSFCFVSLVYLISHWFRREQFPIVIGMSESLGMLVVFFSQFLMSEWLIDYGWRAVIKGQGLLTIFLACCFGLLIRNKPDGKQGEPSVVDFIEFKREVKAVIQSRAVWFISMAGGFVFAVITIFASLWAPAIIEYKAHLTVLSASHKAQYLWPGVFVGLCFYSYIIKKHSSYSLRLLSVSICLLIVLFVNILVKSEMGGSLIGGEMFMLGFFSASYIIVFAIAEKFCGLSTKSTAFGLMNTIMMSMPPIFQPIIGRLVDWHVLHRGGSLRAPIHYISSDFNICLEFLIVLMCLCLFCLHRYKKITNI